MLQEHVAGGLRRVDAHACVASGCRRATNIKAAEMLAPTVIGNDRRAVGGNFELVGGKLQHGSERRRLGHIEHFERQLGVAGQRDLEGHFCP